MLWLARKLTRLTSVGVFCDTTLLQHLSSKQHRMLEKKKKSYAYESQFLLEKLKLPNSCLLRENTPSNAASFLSSWYFPKPSPLLGSFPEHICTVVVSTLLSVALIMIPIIAVPTAVLIQNLCNSSSRTIGKRDLKFLRNPHKELDGHVFLGYFYLKVR